MLQNRTHSGRRRISIEIVCVWGISGLLLILLCGLSGGAAQAQRKDRVRESAQTDNAAIVSSAVCAVSVRNILDQPLMARIRLFPVSGGQIRSVELENGAGAVSAPAGEYSASVYVYDQGVPILVHQQAITLSATEKSEITVSVLEGSAGNRTLRAFDGDFDLVLDRVEVELGSDPANPRSVPGETLYEWPSPVLRDRGGWYKGELHAQSSYGAGSEDVAALIRRAEAAKLDFLAIADPNTLAAAMDPKFKSSKLVLIPAMEWKHSTLGSALILAPASLPPTNVARAEAQALANRLQAQGGIFAVAHPAHPGQSWQWGLNYFNAVEVWFGGWRVTPPLEVRSLIPELQVQLENGDYAYPIAAAAAMNMLSANGQATLYYDIETTGGSRAAMIAGSGSTGRKIPLGEPLTYVWAKEQSLNGILDGIRRGRTFVTSGPKGPFVEFMADINGDDRIDVGSGGMVPINVKSKFIVGIQGAKDAHLEILFNGYPIRSRKIEGDRFLLSVGDEPGSPGVYRVRITESTNERKGFGPGEVLAMSSPIYAHAYFVDESKGETSDGWVNLESNWEDPSTVQVFDPELLDSSQVITLEGRRGKYTPGQQR